MGWLGWIRRVTKQNNHGAPHLGKSKPLKGCDITKSFQPIKTPNSSFAKLAPGIKNDQNPKIPMNSRANWAQPSVPAP